MPYFLSSYPGLSSALQGAIFPPSLVGSSFLCSVLRFFLAQHRKAEFMQPSTLCRSYFILITQQVFIKWLLSASTVLGAGNTAVNKAEEIPSVTEFPLRPAREGGLEEVLSELTSES